MEQELSESTEEINKLSKLTLDEIGKLKLTELLDIQFKEREECDEVEKRVKVYQSIWKRKNIEDKSKISDDQLIKELKKFFATSAIESNVDKAAKDKDLREKLVKFLYGEEDIKDRWNNFEVEGLKLSFKSEILCYLHPNDYAIVNEKNVKRLNIITNGKEQIKYNRYMKFEKYQKLCEKIKQIAIDEGIQEEGKEVNFAEINEVIYNKTKRNNKQNNDSKSNENNEKNIKNEKEQKLTKEEVNKLEKTSSLGEKQKEILSDVRKQQTGKNIIFYGVPGCGKSYLVQKIVEEKLKEKDAEKNVERILFHPEYSYSDFIGQILPTVKEKNGSKSVQYEFKAGPFTRILKKALNDEKSEYILIIEEINRGNASAIFGDIFQLLDRRKEQKKDKAGCRLVDSEYPITNQDIYDWLIKEGVSREKLVEGEKIYIPNNLSIYATMNTSDQNVFILDTAFKRRWNLKYVPIDFSAEEGSKNHELFNQNIPLPENSSNKEVTWQEFVESINIAIPKLNRGMNSEDKLIGPYFVTLEELKNADEFAQKVLLYLWNDVTKTDRSSLFNLKIGEQEISTFERLINTYKEKGLKIFANGIFEKVEDTIDDENKMLEESEE